jgi:hypothetical protein
MIKETDFPANGSGDRPFAGIAPARQSASRSAADGAHRFNASVVVTAIVRILSSLIIAA